MSIKKPVQETLIVDDYVIQLRWDPKQNSSSGNPTWIDFEVYAIVGYGEVSPSGYSLGEDKRDGQRLFDKLTDGPQTVTENIEEAEMEARGFVKWDGCTQFQLGDDRAKNSGMAHFDDFEALKTWGMMFRVARWACMKVMDSDAQEDEEDVEVREYLEEMKQVIDTDVARPALETSASMTIEGFGEVKLSHEGPPAPSIGRSSGEVDWEGDVEVTTKGLEQKS